VASLSDLDALADRVNGELGTIEALFVDAGIAPSHPSRRLPRRSSGFRLPA
jgi:NAD(P)-dependent dehydrogenase (short-subunit alcohol dehydrogenase family)